MTKITVHSTVSTPIEQVWPYYVQPQHIMNWNFDTDEWHCPSASCNLQPGGNFSFRMPAKDGSFEFDLKGTYVDIQDNALLSYELEDNRSVQVTFQENTDGVTIEQTFEAEGANSEDQQRADWQAILENFKKYVESKLMHTL